MNTVRRTWISGSTWKASRGLFLECTRRNHSAHAAHTPSVVRVRACCVAPVHACTRPLVHCKLLAALRCLALCTCRTSRYVQVYKLIAQAQVCVFLACVANLVQFC